MQTREASDISSIEKLPSYSAFALLPPRIATEKNLIEPPMVINKSSS